MVHRALTLLGFSVMVTTAMFGCSSTDSAAGSTREADASSRVGTDASAEPVSRVPTAVARLQKMRGDVRWRQVSTASWTPAQDDQRLNSSDAIQTMGDSSAELVFLDTGNVVRLGPGTTLRIPGQTPRVTRFRHMSGRLIASLSEEGTSRMEVELPPGTLVLAQSETPSQTDARQASSPEAHVNVIDDRTAVTMLVGTGRLERREGEPVAIEERRFLEVANSGEVLSEGLSAPVVDLVSPLEDSTVRTRDRVELRWTPVTDIEAYLIEVSPSEGGAGVSQRVAKTRSRLALALESGRYSWSVRTLQGGREGIIVDQWRFTVEVDREAPELVVVSPPPSATIRGAGVRVEGRTEPEAQVIVNGRAAPVDEEGAFTVTIPLRRGLSNIVVRASDDLGNTRAVTRAVLKE